MNKRLQELLEQATYEILGVKQVDQKKFAELIVAECAYTARQCYTVEAIDAEDVAKHIEETLGAK